MDEEKGPKPQKPKRKPAVTVTVKQFERLQKRIAVTTDRLAKMQERRDDMAAKLRSQADALLAKVGG